jgi:hypothetical protein
MRPFARDAGGLIVYWGKDMSIWLRYIAIAVLVGNSLTAFWNVIGLGRMILLGSIKGLDRVAFNLPLYLAAIVLAVLIASPTRQSISGTTKIVAIPCVLGGLAGVLSTGLFFYTRNEPRMDFPLSDLSMERVVDLFLMERAVQNVLFSACTLLLAILVLTSRRSSA